MAKSVPMMRSAYRKFRYGGWGLDWTMYRYAIRYLSGRRVGRVNLDF